MPRRSVLLSVSSGQFYDDEGTKLAVQFSPHRTTDHAKKAREGQSFSVYAICSWIALKELQYCTFYDRVDSSVMSVVMRLSPGPPPAVIT